MLRELIRELDLHKAILVAVSKTKSVPEILKVYNQGQRIFGENRVQELLAKHEQLPKDIKWHFIGNLQKNKVKYITPFVSMIHSVDSIELARTINKYANNSERKVDVLLQMKIASEHTKMGMDDVKLTSILEEKHKLKNVNIRGLMGMASFTNDEDIVREEFKALKTTFNKTKQEYFSADASFDQLSMGMSGDYKIALEEGSTMIRIGSLLFGPRNYI